MLCKTYTYSKSFSLCFKRKELKVSSPSFFFGKSKIPMVEQCRYLGTTISIKNSDLDLNLQNIIHTNFGGNNNELYIINRC